MMVQSRRLARRPRIRNDSQVKKPKNSDGTTTQMPWPYRRSRPARSGGRLLTDGFGGFLGQLLVGGVVVRGEARLQRFGVEQLLQDRHVVEARLALDAEGLGLDAAVAVDGDRNAPAHACARPFSRRR